MGKTYKKQSHHYDDEQPSGRSGKHTKHSGSKKHGGMKTLNSYVDEEYYDLDNDNFDDQIDIEDDIQIQHKKY